MLAALALASLAIFAQGTAAADCTRKYTVKAGDYCDTISAANKASTYQLGAINVGVINEMCDNLTPEQEICLGSTEADCQDVAVVIAGNTCEALWADHDLDKDVFFKNNPQVDADCRNIYIDEVLCMSKTVNVPAAPPADTPIHTAPPAAEFTPPVPLPSTTAAPAFAAFAEATPPPAAAFAGEGQGQDQAEEECTEEVEEIEIVWGPTDEDLPFCDELV